MRHRALRLVDRATIRFLDALLAGALLVVLAPVLVALAVLVKVDSRGPALYRCRRAGVGGREFAMLKFRKMHDGAVGSVLTAPDDERFTRIGRFLARTRLDELPQLWNVVVGHMSLVGPRPEDTSVVAAHRDKLEIVLSVRPGITGLSQIAFARESDILDPLNRMGHYEGRILPQKIALDSLYASRRSVWLNLRILAWTAIVAVLGRDVAVHRGSGRMRLRRRPAATALETLSMKRSEP